MIIFAQAFTEPKSGSSQAEYEDAYWPCTTQENLELMCFRCAVADGATETSYSKVWANQLVRSICRHEQFGQAFLLETLPTLQQRWSRFVHRRIRRKPLPWYVEEKIRSGAAASLLGIEIRSSSLSGEEGGTWTAIAVGDSCLVQMRATQVIEKFPLTDAVSFNNHPYLISSHPSSNSDLKKNISILSGTWCLDDEFYLMTDALAHWYMTMLSNDMKPWEVLRDMGTSGEKQSFGEWIQEMRKQGRMRNDDITLFRVSVV